MRILIILNKYEYRGGEDTYVDNLVHLLRLKRHIVRVYIKDSRSIKGVFSKIETIIKMFWNPVVSKELIEVIDKFKPEVAHFHNIFPLISPIAYKTCNNKGVYIVQTIHNYKYMCPKNDLYRAGKFCSLCTTNNFFPSIFFGCYHKSRIATLIFVASYFLHKKLGRFDLINAFIFPSRFTYSYYVKYSDLNLNKFHYLPYHVPPPITKEQKGNSYFLYVGRLTDEKGILPLAQVISKKDSLQLYIIGDGPLKKEIFKLSQSKRQIKYLGQKPHSETIEYIARSKAVIVPSLWYEVLPLVILEAVRMQKCVYVSQHNPNLKRLRLSSSKIHTYSSLENLIGQLKKNIHSPHNHSGVDQLIRKTNPNFHYKKLISIYRHANK